MKCVVLFKKDVKCVVLFKKDEVLFKKELQGKSTAEESERSERGRKRFSSGRSFWENAVRETVFRGKDAVYRAVRTINAMESLKVMAVRYFSQQTSTFC